ncbi:hypothetical protein [Methanobrevibacter sp.]|uniref:hypothetical protein n=1 Tax=Methanobrevibacter sp. TaxID=66852 RepID=UPI0038639AF5
MDKKIFLIAFIALMLSMSVVSAAENFKNEKFDGFSIDVPKNSSFAKAASDEEVSSEFGEFESYADDSNMLIILYSHSPMISEDNVDFWYQGFFQSMNPDLDSCWETQQGNMKLLYPMTSSEASFSLAGFNEGNQTVIIMGPDKDLIELMGSSFEFN